MTRIFTSLISVLVVASTFGRAQRDTSFPACDKPDGSPAAYTKTADNPASDGSIMMQGNALPWGPGVDFAGDYGYTSGQKRFLEKRGGQHFVTTDPVFYTAPGTGACGLTYTNQSVVACLKPGWINSANKNGCNKWVEAKLPALGTRVTAQVVDACGALPANETTFDCGDIYLSLAAYATLARGDQAIIDAGRLPGPVVWHFIKEPCWACEGGLDGKLPNGDIDDCQGVDCWGELRTGRKTCGDIKVGAEAGAACATACPVVNLDMSQFKSAVQKQVKGRAKGKEGR